MKLITWPYYSHSYLQSQGLSDTILERFLAKIRIDPDTGCWVWTGFIHDGYGYISRGYKNRSSLKAAMVAWILYRGPIPEGLHILHKCPKGHNKACVNPQHLKPGTVSENMQDVIASGKHYFSNHKSPRGENSPSAKLTQQQGNEIRHLYASGAMKQIPLAKKFCVSQATIWNVIHNVTLADPSGG